jgi:ABC-type phosphate/phosphonate transport system substrate-binding protein/rhodanese-related sulfurtransferase
MNKLSFLLALASLISAEAVPAADSLMFSVNVPDSEEINNFDSQRTYQDLANYLSKATGIGIKLVVGQNATGELQRTRTGFYALILGPSHIIGSALKYGYDPVVKFPGSNKVVFVTTKNTNIARIDQAKGKRLGLPAEDSLATYLARGELNAAGIQAKSYFKSIHYSHYQDSALYSLSIGQVDLVAVDESVAKKWLMKNSGVIIAEGQAVPALSIAINTKIPKALQDKLRNTLLQPHAAAQTVVLQNLHIEAFEPSKRDDYKYVETLGYFTPTLLPGATVVNPQQAKVQMDKGVAMYDTRVEHEYQEGHIKGAINLPYKENSAKEVDFDSTLDNWEVAQLPKDKNTPLIFACNGPECWKSYKSAKTALDNKYTKVYWFRGGFPEWKKARFATE